tara:strand:+ start:698 stop:1435 length:738 start_codon:yes stop_codon:yes gene_type:complete
MAINNTTLQIKFRQRLNKIASNDYDNIECWQIVEAFNKAQIEWCRRQLHGNNMYKEGDEMSKRRIDDLQILLTDVGMTFNDSADFIESTVGWFPENYLEYKRVTAEAYTDCCPLVGGKEYAKGRVMTVYLAEEANVDLYMRDPLKNPNFEWGETYCTMQGNQIRIYKKDFILVDPLFTYYRRPREIQILGCVDPYTLVESGADVICEFKDDIVEIMIDEAVAVIAGDIDNINQYVRGSGSAEKNN